MEEISVTYTEEDIDLNRTTVTRTGIEIAITLPATTGVVITPTIIGDDAEFDVYDLHGLNYGTYETNESNSYSQSFGFYNDETDVGGKYCEATIYFLIVGDVGDSTISVSDFYTFADVADFEDDFIDMELGKNYKSQEQQYYPLIIKNESGTEIHMERDLFKLNVPANTSVEVTAYNTYCFTDAYIFDDLNNPYVDFYMLSYFDVGYDSFMVTNETSEDKTYYLALGSDNYQRVPDFKATSLCYKAEIYEEKIELVKASDGNLYLRNTKTNELVRENGFYTQDGVTYYLFNGAADLSSRTLVKYEGKWYYINKGKLDKTETLVKYGNSYYYVKNGEINYTETLVKYNGVYWHVKNGKLCRDTGLVKYNKIWWYVKNGKLDGTYTGLTKYNNTWWYVKNGKLNTTTTLTKQGNTWWYVSGGKINTKYSGAFKFGSLYYNIKNGKVQSTYTGLVKVGSWWYVKNGKIQTSYTGTYKWNGIKWKIVKGKVTGKA
jgi:hypothetical protein